MGDSDGIWRRDLVDPRLPDVHCGMLVEEGKKLAPSGVKVVERGSIIAAITEFEVSANVQYGFSQRILRDS